MSNKQITKEFKAIICNMYLQLEESQHPKAAGGIGRWGEAVHVQKWANSLAFPSTLHSSSRMLTRTRLEIIHPYSHWLNVEHSPVRPGDM